MKKIYQQPTTQVVLLNGGKVCQSLIIGSGGGSDEGTGDGTDLVKEERTNRGSCNVWDDDWSKE